MHFQQRWPRSELSSYMQHTFPVLHRVKSIAIPPPSLPRSHFIMDVVYGKRPQGTSEDVSGVDIVIDLVENIVNRINDRRSLVRYRDIKLELESLHQTLSLTGIAIQALEYTALPVSNFKHHVWQCFQVLQDVFDDFNRYRQSLQSKISSTGTPRFGGTLGRPNNWLNCESNLPLIKNRLTRV